MPSIADAVDLIEAALPGVTVRLGEEYQQENNVPPRVVFIPRNDRYAPSRVRDRDRFHTASILTRGVGLEARIWGLADPDVVDPPSYPDLRATELLVDKVLLKLRAICEGSIEFEDGEWMPTSAMQSGRGYILRVRIGLPVVPTDADATVETTSWTEVLAPEDIAEAGPAITTTVELNSDEVGVPSP